jgi:hypothetical protein
MAHTLVIKVNFPSYGWFLDGKSLFQPKGETVLKQAWVVGRQWHDRMTRLVFQAGWSLPISMVVIIVSMPLWRGAVAEAESQIVQQIDYEDTTLCVKFGFVVGTQQHFSCKLDLLDLRHSHEQLIGAYSMP